ncbi:glutamyl-tRNA(Gln) amidotransferase, C subunit [Solidesulfovibrio carbinoliphilus subsp. oakridgensis]|uniref:Aspartyl/glutamyl-tRNA(Asn/Gln) amidotransferase subunit C n=1 Tax=Solidesulfovibrio carbinoliphilus subsp. oakridgensis TaxID=694327 RepID=G7QBR2_9BACT|nr:Asp-tRNA(Asn)/Glu-tRNA(Gln) amidotransferase subunit GatC [Solidesulfovibrio carbinoliphilus]EHJ49405.1 glutamyl-tRNA(Gln) amidotransferase, C subunit [Solidesulfovibrio carbinoliphilus subsp. oakridgensis]
MKIRPDEVAKVAKLARLRLDDDSLEAFAGQMDGILAYMETLGAVDTDGVEPLYSPVLHETPLRADVATKACARDRILANAPATDGQFFIVPKIV